MEHLVQNFKEGGPAMLLILSADMCMLCTIVLALAIAFAMRGSAVAKVAGAMCALGALAPLAIGVGGYWWGMEQVNAALSMVDPAQKELLRAMGTAEAMTNIWFGAGSLICTLPGAALVLGVAFIGRKADGSPDIE